MADLKKAHLQRSLSDSRNGQNERYENLFTILDKINFYHHERICIHLAML